MSALEEPLLVFCSVAPEDETLCSQLHDHLRPLEQRRVLDIWCTRPITAGTDWTAKINVQLAKASIILLLISSSFFACDDCYSTEMRSALQQREANGARIIPILLRPLDWNTTPFTHLAVLPDNRKPLTEWRNRDAAFANVVAGIRRVIEELTRPLEQRRSVVPSQVWNVPYLRNPHFTGRDELLERLDQQLSPAIEEGDSIVTRRAALTQPQAIKGLGGIGKTQIAVEYAYRSRDRGKYTHTLWVNAASEETIIASFVTVAELLPSFSAKSETDQRKLVEAVKHWLEQCRQRWLLIFDNADEIALVHNYLPQGGNGSILLTTRANAVGSLAASIRVEEMDRWDGTLFLLRRAQLFEHASIMDASDEEVEMVNVARSIVDALDSFPLALDQAGAYIEETKCNLADYLQIYQDHRKDLLARRGYQVTNYPDSVATTWSLSFQKVEQANPAAADLLRLCAFLAPDKIPEELITNAPAQWTPLLQQAASDPFVFNQMMADLLKFSLVERLTEAQIFSIHRLVQAVQMDTMDSEMQRQWAERVIRAVNEIFPDRPQDIATWPQCLRYLDQTKVCDALIEQYTLPLIEAANLLYRTGRYLYESGLYTIAESLYQHALLIFEEQLGANHSSTAITLNDLASLYECQGRYIEAESFYQRALAIDTEVYGADHLEVGISLNNLAYLYESQGKFTEAEPLYQRAIAIKERQLGTEHLSTAASLGNLGSVYRHQGKYAEAEPLLKRALAIKEQQLGTEHPSTAANLNELSALYWNQGKYAEAEPLLKRALAIKEQPLGTEHPSTATSLSNLAILYRSQGKYAEAEPLLKRALRIREQRLGPEHPQTQLVRNNCILLLRDMGRDEEARRMEESS